MIDIPCTLGGIKARYVRAILEYVSAVWDPYVKKGTLRIDQVRVA